MDRYMKKFIIMWQKTGLSFTESGKQEEAFSKIKIEARRAFQKAIYVYLY